MTNIAFFAGAITERGSAPSHFRVLNPDSDRDETFCRCPCDGQKMARTGIIYDLFHLIFGMVGGRCKGTTGNRRTRQ